jgi:thiamine kinase-like enzyme
MNHATAVRNLVRERLAPGSAVEVVPLSGGITNRNYRVELDGEARWVARLFGARTGELGIDREVEFHAISAAAAQGFAPQVVAWWPDDGMLVTTFVAGETLSPLTASEPAALMEIAAALRHHHEGPPCGGRFLAAEIVDDYLGRCRAAGVKLPAEIGAALARIRAISGATAARREADGLRSCHNDLLPGNFLRTNDGAICIIDWEYAGMGDRFFDLGNLAVNLEFDEAACENLLAAYFGEYSAADRAHLHLMRVASDLREAMWGFLQTAISDLDEDFETYGRRHLYRFLANASDPRFARWLVTLR